MNRKSFNLFGALLTVSLVPTAGCMGEMDESTLDPAEDVEVVEADSEAIKIGAGEQPAGELVLQRRAIKRVDEAGNEQQNFVASPSFFASSTSNATFNTVNYNVALYAGDTLTIGTCGLAGATSSGDTFLRLYNPFGGEVASNDDACGSASKIVYTAPSSGTYQLRAGCFGNNACSGTLAYSFSAPLFSYSGFNTNSAQQNTTNLTMNIGSFNSLKFGTCGITGATGSGDTYLRLYNASNILVAANDDACGALSQLTFSSGSLPPGTYSLRAGCWSSSSCSGTVAYSLE